MNTSEEPLRRILDVGALMRMPVSDGLTGAPEAIEESPRRRVVFLPRENGPVVLWTRPQPGRSYVIGAHYSSNYSVAFVVNQGTGEQVAQFRERVRPGQFAEYLSLLGELYNLAYIVPEAADTEFIAALLRTRYPEERVYKRRALAGGRDGVAGFEINHATRPLLISALAGAVLGFQGKILIRSPLAVRECLTFVIRADGTPGAASGGRAECVWAAALAAYGVQELQKFAQAKERAAHLAAGRRFRSRPDYDD